MQFLRPRDLRSGLVSAFRASYDAEPARLGRAPGRVNLIGEHTDYNAGLCLPIALEHSTWVALTPRPDGRVRIRSAQAGLWEGTVDDRDGWASYVTATLRELDVPGADIQLDSDVPLGSGLSSSAALICALTVALGSTSVEAAIRAETGGVGAPTGGLDQTISLLGRRREALLIDFQTHQHRPVSWDPESAGLSVLVIDTRVSHAHETGGYGERRRECEEAAARLGLSSLREVTDPHPTDPRVRHVVTEIQRVRDTVSAVAASHWARVGEIFTASHRSLRDDFEVSCAELDLAVEAAVGAGALGARMTGGGFGGSAIALVPSADLDRIARAVENAFDGAGLRAPQFLVARASDGAAALT